MSKDVFYQFDKLNPGINLKKDFWFNIIGRRNNNIFLSFCYVKSILLKQS